MSSVIKIDYSLHKVQQMMSLNNEPYEGCFFEHQDDFEPSNDVKTTVFNINTLNSQHSQESKVENIDFLEEIRLTGRLDENTNFARWVEKDGSLVIELIANSMYIRVLPGKNKGMGSMSYATGARDEEVGEGEAHRLGWKWNVDLPDLDLVSLVRSCDGMGQAFFGGISPAVLDNLATYKYHQVIMLRLAAVYDDGAQLALSSPNLLWLIADAIYNKKILFTSAKHLMRKKRRDILFEILGVKVSVQSVKVINKFSAYDDGQLTEFDFKKMLLLFDSVISDSFRHWVRITPDVVVSKKKGEENLTGLLFTHLKDKQFMQWQEAIKSVKKLMSDVKKQMAYHPEREPELQRFTHINQIKNAHQRWIIEDQSIWNKDLLELDDPDAPFPELNFKHDCHAGFKRLNTPRELYLEGEEMSHCIYSHLYRARSEKYAYFSVSYDCDIRLTLEIKQNPDKRWVVEELVGKENREYKFSERNFVNGWVEGLLFNSNPPINNRDIK